MDHLEYLTLIGNRAEGAVHQTHPAGDTLILIDLGTAQFITRYGVNAACFRARALQLDDRSVRAGIDAPSAVDALLLIDPGMSVYHRDRPFRADFLARMRETSLARIRYLCLIFRTGMARKFNNIDKGRIVIFLCDRTLLNSARYRRMFCHIAKRQADRKAQALFHDRALQENAFTVGRDLSRNNLIRQIDNP